MTKRFDIIGLTEATTIVGGDDKELRISIPNIPDTQLVEHCILLVKRNIGDLDGDAILTKDITTANQNGTGQIEDTGALVPHTAIVRIDITNDDTPLLVMEDPYRDLLHFQYALKAATGTGKMETAVWGYISALAPVVVQDVA